MEPPYWTKGLSSGEVLCLSKAAEFTTYKDRKAPRQ